MATRKTYSVRVTICSLLLAVAFFLQNPVCRAQVKILIYADTGNAFIRKCSSILEQQLKKSENVQVSIAPPRSYAGSGILLSALPAEWPAYSRLLKGKGTEAILVKSKGQGLVILGNSDMAVQHGVFIYLEAIGFRYYFPHPDWYIIPAKLNLYPAIDYLAEPSFDQRRIWYGYSSAGSKISNENYAFWFMANKLGGAMNAVIGHAYDDIVSRNLTTFKEHPEWFYPKVAGGTIPQNPKFDLANESLVQFIISDALKRLEKAKASNIPVSMITLSPSDGSGTCNTPACQQLGTITDRVYFLINRVAKEVGKKYPGTWVSGMAYSEYAAPPSKKLEPNTFVSIATAFNSTKFTVDQLVGAWSKKAGKVGIYDYLGLYAWDFDLPGKGMAAVSIEKINAHIKNYYKLGAKGYDTETTPGSINKGLGHYMVARLLWDVRSNTAMLEKEFFTKCFGSAATLMAALWTKFETYSYTAVRESDLASWIDQVDEAARFEKSPEVQKRFTHIKVYFHYLFLYNRFLKTNSLDDRLALLNYSYNTFDIAAFSGYPALWQLGQASGLPGMMVNDPNAKYKKLNPQFSQAGYIDQLIAADRKTLTKKDNLKQFTLPGRFQKILEPENFKAKKYDAGIGNYFCIGPHYFVFEISKQSQLNYIDMSGGIVTGGGGDKSIDVSISVYNSSLENNGKTLLKYSYFNKEAGKVDIQRIDLQKLPKGYYLIKVDDPRKYFNFRFSPAVSYAMMVTPQNRFWGTAFYMCFNVPKNTTGFRIFKDSEVALVSPTGRNIDLRNKKNEEVDVKVQPGEEGLWFVPFVKGQFHIEGIPPFMGLDASHMLIPE